ncbi:hypothetical protein Dacet_1253 [Denitrovibrio acetiphilus DSM 12809]|uniref:Uncharacterized protein n=1 Tax=Denitrovibrio acetiphilus (strain DSM 12809 / NBRC 114555 / N2460) TaxID=522772 RepID=D4H7M6_DENA2|nr:hypothetical protein [Denitrovibrio acetiphilus]ADD68025.1 hypothetical protein Dacet_1253 [Denitrovibrio acetiphilus DSM 12809]
MDTKWVKESFDKGKNEILKFAKTSKIKIEITSLNKKKDERTTLLGNKVLELIENGELDPELFEPDYTYIKNIENDISEKEELLKAASTESEEDLPDEADDDVDIVNIESQKVLTANSIPVEPSEEDTEEQEGKNNN